MPTSRAILQFQIRSEAQRLLDLSNADERVEYGREVFYGRSGFRFGRQYRGFRGGLDKDIPIAGNAVALIHSHPDEGTPPYLYPGGNVSGFDRAFGVTKGIYVVALNSAGQLSMSYWWTKDLQVDLDAFCAK